MSDDFGSGAYLARTGQLGYSRPAANTSAGGNPVSNYFSEGFPLLGTVLPGFGKTSEHPLSTVKLDTSKGVDVLIEPAPKQSPLFASPWQNSKLTQAVKSIQDALKSTATIEQVYGVPLVRRADKDEGISR